MFLTYSVEFVMLMIFAVVYQQNVTDCYRLLQMHAVYKCRVFHHSLILYPSYILLRISEFCLASRHYLFKMLSCNVCVCVRARTRDSCRSFRSYVSHSVRELTATGRASYRSGQIRVILYMNKRQFEYVLCRLKAVLMSDAQLYSQLFWCSVVKCQCYCIMVEPCQNEIKPRE